MASPQMQNPAEMDTWFEMCMRPGRPRLCVSCPAPVFPCDLRDCWLTRGSPRRWCCYCLCEGFGLASIGSPLCKADSKMLCIKSQGVGDCGIASILLARVSACGLMVGCRMHPHTMRCHQGRSWAKRVSV
jgi:hypothetical protein